jgi:hypothetical protein
MQHLSLTDRKSAYRLPIPAGEMKLGRMVQQGWIEMQGKDYNTVVRLTGAGLKAMRSQMIRQSSGSKPRLRRAAPDAS